MQNTPSRLKLWQSLFHISAFCFAVASGISILAALRSDNSVQHYAQAVFCLGMCIVNIGFARRYGRQIALAQPPQTNVT